MTEIERLLSDTLTTLEQELRQTQENHEKILANQQNALTIQVSTLQQVQQQVSRLSAQQQKSVQQLQNLSSIHKRLEPLLADLNGILSINPKK